MPRTYIKKQNTRRLQYSNEDAVKAQIDLKSGNFTIRQVSVKYGIPITTLHRHRHGMVAEPGQSGRSTALLRNEEVVLAENVAALGDFGLAFDVNDLRRFVQVYLNKRNRAIPQFNDNLPGSDWARGFLERHSDIISYRHCQNISRKETRDTSVKHQKPRSKRVKVAPGKTVTTADLNEPSTSGPTTSTPKPAKRHHQERVIKEDDEGQESEEEETEEENQETSKEEELDDAPPARLDYILVAFGTGRKRYHYVGQLLEETDEGWNVEFYRAAEGNKIGGHDLCMFKLPTVQDRYIINSSDIVKRLKLVEIIKNKVVFKKSELDNFIVR